MRIKWDLKVYTLIAPGTYSEGILLDDYGVFQYSRVMIHMSDSFSNGEFF
jgi:hypothetical protein